jgi:Tfp pilus assembly protein PilF
MTTVNLLSPSGLFAYTGAQTGQLENLARNAVNNGLSLFTNKNYEGAIKEYQRAIALAPNSDLVADAYNSMGQAHTQLGDNEKAIQAYQQAIQRDPTRSDIRATLGNVHYFQKDYAKAVEQYEAAVRTDPSAANRFSLGQGYMAAGNFSEAEYQFARVRDMAPNEPSGHYGLGQLYAKQGRPDKAIEEFQAAIDIKWDFWDAYVEQGYAYVDSGDTESAEKIATYLDDQDATRAATLATYITQQRAPTMSLALSGGSFVPSLGPNTPVSFLGLYTPDESQTLAMAFQFDKAMDRASVENITNWTISRSTNTGLGNGYNYGLPVADTEVTLSRLPLAVYYDANSLTATVYFSVSQNADLTATIDPSHIQFTFSGVDGYGITVDPATDRYAGFSGFA